MSGTYAECKAYVEEWEKIQPFMRFRIDIAIFETDGDHTYVVVSEPW